MINMQVRLQARVEHRENLARNLQKRLLVAKGKGDTDLIFLLEREANYLGLWTILSEAERANRNI